MPKVITTEERELNRFSDFVRGELLRQGKRQKDLADYILLDQQSVSNRITGKSNWTGKDIVLTLQFLGRSYEFGRERVND